METFEPTKDEIEMAFVASCIETVAERLNCPYIDIFERMERVGLIDKYIYPCYETLHSESRENLTDSLVQTLLRWENAA
ncbi:MAG: DUF3791 domain-containing protein [Bacteroidales bacterium]|nr:DUF3791 domain-containing protein [Bacteroidales bacterium]MDE6237135.1 DUF3791 domain-containing protein [Muribaculaceae bacterium]MDE6536814.1 DUF3791 domain-containing protein [Muribaculaceae bacterium]MDE6866548.1 DUF3791 domain-containing protein [Muribaculaceae bacterium]